MFEKTLQDLVKGIRANKRDPGAFISQAIAEIKVELKNVDPFIKVGVHGHSQELRSNASMHFLLV
jgi:AP-3 complex subunit delta